MTDQIRHIPGASLWLTKAIDRINKGRPYYRGKAVDPHGLPDRPTGKNLAYWLKTSAPEDVKAYCRESMKFYREHRDIAPDWYGKMEQGFK